MTTRSVRNVVKIHFACGLRRTSKTNGWVDRYGPLLWLQENRPVTGRYISGSIRSDQHLDLKPENILFRETSEGKWDVPKLADWGVSRELAEQTGTVEGLSVRYAAPEQFEPQEFGDPDMLTDIYQVGVLLYTIFTGDAPYTGGQLATMRAVVDGEEPTAPSELREGLPAKIDSIIFKAMSREKGTRYRTIGVLANELHSLRETVSARD